MNTAAAQNAYDQVIQWVSFKLDGETYCIDVMKVQEVLRYTEIAPVPGAASYVLGIINLRGKIVTVIDTRARFGLKEDEITSNTRIVIVETSQKIIGILVDSVSEVVYIRQSEIETAPNVGSMDNAKFIQGVCSKNDELYILVDLDQLLNEDEWLEVEKV